MDIILSSFLNKLTGGLQRQSGSQPLKTFTESLEAFRTAMAFRFFDWLTNNIDVLSLIKRVWAIFGLKSCVSPNN